MLCLEYAQLGKHRRTLDTPIHRLDEIAKIAIEFTAICEQGEHTWNFKHIHGSFRW